MTKNRLESIQFPKKSDRSNFNSTTTWSLYAIFNNSVCILDAR